jgi:hypothetical protein
MKTRRKGAKKGGSMKRWKSIPNCSLAFWLALTLLTATAQRPASAGAVFWPQSLSYACQIGSALGACVAGGSPDLLEMSVQIENPLMAFDQWAILKLNINTSDGYLWIEGQPQVAHMSYAAPPTQKIFVFPGWIMSALAPGQGFSVDAFAGAGLDLTQSDWQNFWIYPQPSTSPVGGGGSGGGTKGSLSQRSPTRTRRITENPRTWSRAIQGRRSFE